MTHRYSVMVLGLLFSGLLLAQEGRSEGSVWGFYAKKYDQNHDGKITPKEYTRPGAAFKRLDQNSDGFLTEADFADSGRRGSRRGGMNPDSMLKRFVMMIADNDSDGAISKTEWAAFKKTLDSDRNGTINEKELIAAGGPSGIVGRMIQRLDQDADDKTTLKDFDLLFAKFDADQNGALEKKELNVARTDRGRGRRPGAGGANRSTMMIKRTLNMIADTDGNAEVDAKEWAARLKTLGDQKGVISEDDLIDAGAPIRMLRRGIGFLDHDGDGKLTTKDLNAQFTKLDLDASGSLESSELKTSRRGNFGGRRGGQGGNRPGRGGPRGSAGSGPPKVGDQAPDFNLPVLGKAKKSMKLSSFIDKKPVALIFGSYT